MAAAIEHGKSLLIRTNSAKPNRIYGYLHAETAALLAARSYGVKPQVLFVTRTTAKGKNTMSLPCPACQKALRDAGVRIVHYTDWSGEWKKLSLT